MQTLDQLKSGKLIGCKSLKLSEGLLEFPKEIFSLADALEILDLSGNKLSQLPNHFPLLSKLKILFLSDNQFTHFPEILSQLPELEMVGFKSNKIMKIPQNAFPTLLRWLILTNNQIKEIPPSIGKCHRLQKVMFAGNQLSTLPSEMSNCKNLELLRISANQFEEIPNWLFSMPKLSWLALGGNPWTPLISKPSSLQNFDWDDLDIKEKLGEGASGIISKAFHKPSNKEIAIKIFKGDVTSDGWPKDEMESCMAVGQHDNLVKVIGIIVNHPESKNGLAFELIPSNYRNLGGPPSFDTCTRDVFTSEKVFSINETLQIALGVAKAALHLHNQKVTHADLYAHNVLVDKEHAIFGDFGAAFTYPKNFEFAESIEKIEVRAWGCLLEDLWERTDWDGKEHIKQSLFDLKNDCLNKNVLNRPDFNMIINSLDSIHKK